MQESNTNTYTSGGDIQIILSKSYSLFFFAFIIGIVLDLVFGFKINVPGLYNIGLILVAVSSLWVYWAQTVNKSPKFLPDGSRDFTLGPYKYSRHPTYFGIFVMMFGAGLVTNSLSLVFVSIIAFVISVFTFMNKEEKRHIKKYGDNYLNYMKKVRKII